MDPVKRAELRARLEELKAEMKEKSLPGARVTNGVPSDIRAFLAEVAKKQRAALREAYSNREPLILRLNSRQDPCASPPAFSEDGEGKEA
ncbi:60S ribosomal protein L35-3-like [Triticum dicoccoides]|uniref:60S ribosomal protein L35-3-like n=1 Tax=Triticum dicoccoides TaxID=85692 RepID=UPI00188FE411|nr:60S ribosomal protein L35-3-like [Triticum dicoccoides]